MSKKLYEQPTTKVLVVRVGGCMCISNYGAKGAAGAVLVQDSEDEYDL